MGLCRKVAIVSLSRGTIGESFVAHEIELGVSRLKEMGLEVVFMPNSMKGIEYLNEHPEKRADDLIAAFKDESVDMILCAIGGDDTYRLLPYLFENDRLKNCVTKKVFLGFSDSTFNHLMLHKVGLDTFYGQSFLADVCEMDTGMLPYSEQYLRELVNTGTIKEITPSDIWYDERTDWSQISARPSHPNKGFELLQGKTKFSGRILGGCLDSLYDIFDNTRYSDTVSLCEKYSIFPSLEDWKDKILLLETSEETPSPEKYRKFLEILKKRGVFDVLSGVITGKPINEVYHEEYKKALVDVIDDKSLPIVCNINIGHSTPRCIIPFGKMAFVDTDKQVISFS